MAFAFFWDTIDTLGGGASYRARGIQSEAPSSRSTPSAITVNFDIAMSVSAVWACARLISEAIGTMPLLVYERTKGGEKVQVHSHPLADLLNGQPFRHQTGQEYMETITLQKCLDGNNFSYIKRGNTGRIYELEPLMSRQVDVALDDTGALKYRYYDGSGSYVMFDASEVWHNKLFGNGVIGLSPLQYARNTIGIAAGAESATTNIYRNGGKQSGILTVDAQVTADQRSQLKTSYSDITSNNNDRMLVLPKGVNFTPTSLSPQDIELLSSRRFQVQDIARFFGVPGALLNDTDGITWGGGLNAVVQAFYKFTLRPYVRRYQQSITQRLFTKEERARFMVEYDSAALLAPEFADRVKGYKEAITGGLMAPNEARAREGMKPQAGGDSIYMQQQMTPLETLHTLDRTKAAPATPQPEDK